MKNSIMQTIFFLNFKGDLRKIKLSKIEIFHIVIFYEDLSKPTFTYFQPFTVE